MPDDVRSPCLLVPGLVYNFKGSGLSRNPYFRIMVNGSDMVVVIIYVSVLGGFGVESTPLDDISSTRHYHNQELHTFLLDLSSYSV